MASQNTAYSIVFRAQETIENSLIQDNAAVDIIKTIDYDFSKIKTDRLT